MFLYYIIIAPIEMIVDWVFLFFIRMGVGGVITAIIGVSMAINFLALPLYNIADALQDKERQVQRRLAPRLKRIKKAFRGDEQFMMINTYYRQNNYHPLYVLRSSLSILIEIPFFIAAYHYLSHSKILLGQSFWIFKDLGSPDNIWTLRMFGLSLAVNILPIIMTVINVVSAAIYTRGGTFQEKVQIYVLALVFLVLLYNSPSGLVIYWILNNLFSLAKNVIQKMKHPKAILSFVLALCCFCLYQVITMCGWTNKYKYAIPVALLGCVFVILPFAVRFLSNKGFFENLPDFSRQNKTETVLFICCCLCLSLLFGMLLPANIIGSSPLEFANLGKTGSPLSYIGSSFFIFLGMFTFWPVAIYLMFDGKVKHTMSLIFSVMLICALCNIYIFKPDYGNLNNMFILSLENRRMTVPLIYSLLSGLVAVACVAVYYLLRHFNRLSWLVYIYLSIGLAIFAFSIYRINFISGHYKEFNIAKRNSQNETKIEPFYHLTKTGKNVAVIFLDRAIGAFLPYITEEFPELKSEFSGFTFYPNCISYGEKTNVGSPAMMGGYEYIPAKIQERKDELLVDKHNESAKVVLKLFADAGYDVRCNDMPWLNYNWGSDYHILDGMEHVTATNLTGKYLKQAFSPELLAENGLDQIDKICRREINFFNLTQAMFPPLRLKFYTASITEINDAINIDFLESYSALVAFNELTTFDNTSDTFTFITNNSTHEFKFMNAPKYSSPVNKEPADINSISAYKSDNEDSRKGYQVNVASLLQVAKWLDFLKANNCYDNTRIIITSDHGHSVEFECFNKLPEPELAANHNSLLMFKDFGAAGDLTTDSTFMTNADTLFLAKQDLPISNINPYTGKLLEQTKNLGVGVHYNTHDWNATVQKQKRQFNIDFNKGYIVRDNIFDSNCWTRINAGKE